MLIVHSQGIAQSNAISGTVVSAVDNSPLPGVTVTLKGKTQGTVTDGDGRFTINAESSDILVFSFIGMETQEVTVGDQRDIQIKMTESIASLGEVVIVGYGTQKKTTDRRKNEKLFKK